MKQMRALLLLALIPCLSAWAQVRTADEVLEQRRRDEAEAMTLPAAEVNREIRRQMELYRMLPSGGSAFANLMAPELVRATAFTTALERRAAAGDAQAAFYAGLRRLNMCNGMAKANMGASARECQAEAMQYFEQAHRAGIAEATYNIGTMYENGEGVLPSKLAASDWYYQAAQRYSVVGDRSRALTALEAALAAAPDHGPAKRLRSELMK